MSDTTQVLETDSSLKQSENQPMDPVLDLGKDIFFKIKQLHKNLVVTDFGLFILDKRNPLLLEKYYIFKKKGLSGYSNSSHFMTYTYADDDNTYLLDLKYSRYQKGGRLSRCDEQIFKSEVGNRSLLTKDYIVVYNHSVVEIRHLDAIHVIQKKIKYSNIDDDSDAYQSLTSHQEDDSVHGQITAIASEDSNHIAISFHKTDSEDQGHIYVINLNDGEVKKLTSAHKSNIQCMAFSLDGKFLATCSEKGTLIRIFATDTLEKVRELRRGLGNAEMFSLAFSDDNSMLCCYSSSNTVHLFSLADFQQNKKSLMQGLKFISKYVDSEWSIVNTKHSNLTDRGICWLSPSSNASEPLAQVHILTYNGVIMTITFDISSKERISVEEGNLRELLYPIHQNIIASEIKDIRKQFPNCVPFLILPKNASQFTGPQFENFRQVRIFVNESVKIGELAYSVAKRINLNPNKTINFYVKDEDYPMDINLTVKQVEQSHLKKDHLCLSLYIEQVE